MKEGPVDGNLIQSNLAKKQPVVMMGKGGPYGSSMHYMVAESNGDKGKVNVVDPSNGARKSVKGSELIRNTSSSIYSWGKGTGTNGIDPAYQGIKVDPQLEKLEAKYKNAKDFSGMATDPHYQGGYMEDFDPNAMDPNIKMSKGKLNEFTAGIQKEYNKVQKIEEHSPVFKSRIRLQKIKAKQKTPKYGKGRGLWGRGTSGNSLAAGINAADSKSSSVRDAIKKIQAGYRITGKYASWRSTRYHAGIDLVTNNGRIGDPILSFTSGTVETVTTSGGRGKLVVVKDSSGYHHIYQHLNSQTASVGQKVNIGDKVGTQGNSGGNYARHLHYEVRRPNCPSVLGGGVRGYMTTKEMLNEYTVDPFAYLEEYASKGGGKVSENFGSAPTSEGGSTEESSGTMVNGIEVDTTSPKGVGLMTTLANVMSKVADPFTKALNTILMNNDDEEEETSSTDTSGFSGASGDTTQNAQTVYNNLKKAGYPDTNIAGILGNWTEESGIDPTSIEAIYGESHKFGPKKSKAAADFNSYVTGTLKRKYGGKGINWNAYLANGKYYPGIGLGQWTGPRAKGLIDYASANGGNWYDLNTQLKYMLDADGRADWMKKWKSPEKSPEAAAMKFFTGWEGGSTTGWAKDTIPGRKSAAKTWYSKLAGTTAGDTNQVRETSTNYTLLGKGEGLTEDSWGAGRGFDPSATWGSAEWGTGAATNLNNLHSTVSNVSSKIASSFSAAKDNSADAIQNLVSALSSNLKRNLKTNNTTDSTPSDSDNLALIVTLLSQNLSEMLSTLKDIKTNTERNNTLIQSDTDWKKQTYRTSRADNYASSMSGGQPTNVGSKIVDRLTSK